MRHIKSWNSMVKESSVENEGFMSTDLDRAKCIPVDVIDNMHKNEPDITHMVFLLEDERFRNKMVLLPGLITFKTYEEAEKDMETFKSHPKCLENSTNKWRLLDVDEMEAFYEFYESKGMGDYYDLIDGYSFDYATSDLEDIDNPDRSRIYCMNFVKGKIKANYQYQEKALMMIRDITEDDVKSMIKEIHDSVAFNEFVFASNNILNVYPQLDDYVKSFYGDDVENTLKGVDLLNRFSGN
jgi:hypothetical protein